LGRPNLLKIVRGLTPKIYTKYNYSINP
jgi:hypothetical protein